MNKITKTYVSELMKQHPVFVRLAIYPDNSNKKGTFTYRNKPCDILPDESGKFFCNCANAKTEYNTEEYNVRWGMFKFLKHKGQLVCQM